MKEQTMSHTIQIETTPAMRRFNAAVEFADIASGYRFDRCEARHLVKWLDAVGRTRESIELFIALDQLEQGGQ